VRSETTLLHMDVRSANMFTDSTGEEVIWFDWQNSCRGPPTLDLAYLAACMDANTRRSSMEGVLLAYHAELSSLVPTAPSYGDLRSHYRAALVWPLVWSTLTLAGPEELIAGFVKDSSDPGAFQRGLDFVVGSAARYLLAAMDEESLVAFHHYSAGRKGTLFHGVGEPASSDMHGSVRNWLENELGVKGSTVRFTTLKTSQNFTYRLEDEGGWKGILRVSPTVHATREEIEAELAFLRYLKQEAVSVCEPQISGILKLSSGGQSYLATLYRMASGKELTMGNMDWWGRDEGLVERWGAWLGRFHNTSLSFAKAHPEYADRRPAWYEVHQRLLARGLEIYRIHNKEKARAEYAQLMDWLGGLPEDDQTYGLLHGDLNISNLFSEDKTFHVFDWDQCQRGWYVYDLAVVLKMVLFLSVMIPNSTVVYRDFEAALLRGYASQRPLARDQFDWIPRFISVRIHFYNLFCILALHEKEEHSDIVLPDFFPSLAARVEEAIKSGKLTPPPKPLH